MFHLNVNFLVNCLTIVTIYNNLCSSVEIDSNRQWINYKIKYSKSYSNDEDEKRRQLFLNNLETIKYHNDKAARGLESYQLTVNQFTDLEDEETPNCSNDFNQLTEGQQLNSRLKVTQQSGSIVNSSVIDDNRDDDDDDDDLPETVDWRNHGWISDLRHVKACNRGGWAFAVVDAIEGQMFNLTGRLTPLSVAALIDCSFGSNELRGCLNGTVRDGYRYLINNLGLPREKDYPFTGYRRECFHYGLSMVNATIKGYRRVEPTEKALKRAVATVGPISTMMDGAGNFRLYSSGIFNDLECGTRDLFHGVTIVGYGRDENKDYWLVRNNIGPSWGEFGYIRIQRNLNNLCGLATNAYYPIV